MIIEKELARYFKIRYSERLEEYQVHCPYHQDRHKSASINFKKKVFFCFACSFGKTFQQIYDEKINITGISIMPINNIVTDITKINSEPKTSTDFINTLTNLLQEQTTEHRIKQEISEQQAIEYAIQTMNNKGIPLELLDKVNAIPVLDRSDHNYGYIKFPTDNNGHYVAKKFLPDEIVEGPRYVLSTGPRPLVGDITDKYEDYILVEGYLDYFSLKYILGYENVICNLGLAVNKERMYKLKNKAVFILFDNDYKGFEGTEKAYSILRQVKAYPIKLDLPENFGKDANEAIHKHKEEFEEWLAYYIKQSSATDSSYVNDFSNEKKLYTLKSGISIIDKDIFQGGYSVGLHAIAGKPTVGKTAIGLNTAHSIVKNNSTAKVLYITYEVPKKQCWARLASMYDEHSWPEIEKDSTIISPYTQLKMSELAEKIRIVYGWDVSEIARAANNYDAIFIDYIQVMPGDHLDEKTNVSRNIKALSRIMMSKEKIIFVISSIPRSAYDREDLSVFKESGDIEYAIQSGMLISPLSSISEERIMKVNVLKNTRGPVGGTFWLNFITTHNKFEECTPQI